MRCSPLCSALLATALGISVASSARAGVIAYYRFEEGTPGAMAMGSGSVLDSSGHGLNGTPNNGPIYRADVATSPIPQTGAPNLLSLDFNGLNQWVFVPDNPLFQLTHSLTVESYINARSTPAGIHEILFRGDDRPFLDPYTLQMVGDQVVFHIENSSGQIAEVGATLPSLNQWVHVAGTLDDSTGSLRLYINGVLASSTTTSIRPFGALTGANPGLGIGALQSGTGNPLGLQEYFNGLIDEVRISDVALAPSQLLNSVPEPSTLLLSSLGALILLGYNVVRRKRRNEGERNL